MSFPLFGYAKVGAGKKKVYISQLGGRGKEKEFLLSYAVLTSPNKDETAAHGYAPTFIGSCPVGVLQSHLFFT